MLINYHLSGKPAKYKIIVTNPFWNLEFKKYCLLGRLHFVQTLMFIGLL